MKWIHGIRARLRLLFRRASEDRMEEEIRFHVEMETANYIRRGLSPVDARREAALAFGGVEGHKEAMRDERTFAWASGLSLDLKLALRVMRKSPGLTVAAGLGMALAVGVGVGFFIVVHSWIYPELPLDEGDRIVALENWDVRAANEWRRSVHDFVAWREEMRSVEQISAFSPVNWPLADGDAPPQTVRVARMTSEGFQVARVAPLLGRYLLEADDRAGAPQVAVIGHDVWQARFEGDPGVIGREVLLGDSLHTIVGVMPDGYRFPWRHNVWTPLRLDPSAYERGEGPVLFVFGRLAPGATMEQAQVELTAIGRRTAADHPQTHAGLIPQVLPYTYPLDDIQNPGNKTLQFVMGMSFISLLLVVVAANVAILIFARTAMRRGEIAVRSALGASRRRIVGQLFLEALVLSTAAAALGLLLARAAMVVGTAFLKQVEGVGFWVDWGLSLPVVLYAVGLAVLAAGIVGVVPALQFTGRQLQSDLRQLGGSTGQGVGKLWTTLIVVQVATVVAGLPLAATAGWAVIEDVATRARYPEQVLSATLTRIGELRPGIEGEEYQREQARLFGQRLEELDRRLEAEPTVTGVAFMGRLPGREYLVEVEGVPSRRSDGHVLDTYGVDDRYHDLLGLTTLTGRGLRAGDLEESARAVVVSRTFTDRLLLEGDVLGRRLRFVSQAVRPDTGEQERTEWFEIVGVVEDLAENRLNPSLITPAVFYPVAPQSVTSGSLLVRVRGDDPTSFTPRLRAMAEAVDPALVLSDARGMADGGLPSTIWLTGILVLLLLGAVAIFSAAGVHALMSFAVTQRRKEIGIRTALGAGRTRLLAAIFSRAARQVGVGILIGSVAGGVYLIEYEWATIPRVAAILLFTAALTGMVATAAAAGPARRGLSVQPMEALREE